MSHDSIVKLNVGGYKYLTSKSTLLSKGENLFTALLSGRIESYMTEAGYYFIDRNGRYFEPILDYLRTGEIKVDSGLDVAMVLRECEFFLVDDMKRHLEKQVALWDERRLSRNYSEIFEAQGFAIEYIEQILALPPGDICIIRLNDDYESEKKSSIKWGEKAICKKSAKFPGALSAKFEILLSILGKNGWTLVSFEDKSDYSDWRWNDASSTFVQRIIQFACMQLLPSPTPSPTFPSFALQGGSTPRNTNSVSC